MRERTLQFLTQPVKGAHSFALGIQPAVEMRSGGGRDTGDNTTVITLGIKPGSGTPGASLECATDSSAVLPGVQRTLIAGLVEFSDCRIDAPGDGYILEASPSNVFIGTTSSSPIHIYWAGDSNEDEGVDVVDFSILVLGFGKQAGNPTYDPRSDANGDNQVDITDFSILLALFGTRTPTISSTLITTTVHVTGSRFLGTQAVVLRLDGSAVISQPVALTSDSQGNFAASFALPGGTLAGTHVVKASQRDGRVVGIGLIIVP